MGGVDWSELALVSRAEQWVSAHPFHFIVCSARLLRPQPATGTATGPPAIRARDSIFARDPKAELAREPTGAFRLVDLNPRPGAAKDRGARPLVLPLRKVQTSFPSMITVGRTENNDLVVSDEQVSRFHAYFRPVGARVELADAGSRNGTFVAGRRLEGRGSVVVDVGDRLAFGAVEFQLFDARACWEWLRQLDRF